jgi:diguanylate cyclase
VGGFVIGALFGAAPLALGIIVGVYLARRGGWLGIRDSLTPAQAQQLVRGLFQWTNNLVGDVDQCREQMESLRREAATAASETGAAPAIAELMSQMVQANHQMQQRLAVAEDALAQQTKRIAVYLNEARTDVLTGLANRRELDEQLAKSHAQWQRYGAAYALLLLDADRFKQFNDAHGHLAGDEALRVLARVVGGVLRETDVLARFGGEEFAAVLTLTDADAGRIAAERVRVGVEQATISFERKTLGITVSCGLAEPLPGEQPIDVIRRADAALYASKQAGRNCGHWHDGSRSIAIGRSNQCEADVEDFPPPSDSELLIACDALRDRFMAVTGR